MVSLCFAWSKYGDRAGIGVGQSNDRWIWRDHSCKTRFTSVGGRREPG